MLAILCVVLAVALVVSLSWTRIVRSVPHILPHKRQARQQRSTFRRFVFVAALLSATVASAQTQQRSTTFPSAFPPLVTSLPSTCGVGQLVFKTSATAGLYQCATVNTWTAVGSGGGGTPGGALTSIQYNDGGSFGGSANFLWINTALATPSAPSLATAGTPGVSTYGYTLIARNEVGRAPNSTEATIATGPATLNGTNYIVVTTPALTGALMMDVFRTTGTNSPAYLGSVAPGASLNDQGAASVLTAFLAPKSVFNTSKGAWVADTLHVGPASSLPWTDYPPGDAQLSVARELSTADATSGGEKSVAALHASVLLDTASGNTLSSPNALLFLTRLEGGHTSGDAFGVQGLITVRDSGTHPTNTIGGNFGFDFDHGQTGYAIGVSVGVASGANGPTYTGGTFGHLFSFAALPALFSGSATEYAGLFLDSPDIGMAITDEYGIKIGSHTGGLSKNYGIWIDDMSSAAAASKAAINYADKFVVDVNGNFGFATSRFVNPSSDVVELRDSTTAQSLIIDNTYTSSTNNEQAKLEWASNVFRINLDKGSGGGSYRNFVLRLSGFDAFTVSNSQMVMGVNINMTGANLVTPVSITGQTGYHEMVEMTAPAAGAANTARIYAVDNGAGKTQVCAKFNTGAAQCFATEP